MIVSNILYICYAVFSLAIIKVLLPLLLLSSEHEQQFNIYEIAPNHNVIIMDYGFYSNFTFQYIFVIHVVELTDALYHPYIAPGYYLTTHL